MDPLEVAQAASNVDLEWEYIKEDMLAVAGIPVIVNILVITTILVTNLDKDFIHIDYKDSSYKDSYMTL